MKSPQCPELAFGQIRQCLKHKTDDGKENEDLDNQIE